VAGLFLNCPKEYEGVLLLHGEVGDEELQAALTQFQGVIEQLPPRRSRVVRRPRARTIHIFEVTARSGREAHFRVRCERGTYVRKLIHDLGVALGCSAHMQQLRRTWTGPFGLEECVSIKCVAAAVQDVATGHRRALQGVLWPVEEVVARLVPRVWIDDGAVHSVCCGYPLAVPGVCALTDWVVDDVVAVLTMKGELIGLGRALMASHDILGSARGLAARMERVLMARDRYASKRKGMQ
jgi:H/ACA ribonucleoprotein complex subunit 4